MDIPEKYCTAIESIYTLPQFRVKIRDSCSEWQLQSTGIRQGCPLSPYLFIILMTVLFRDVHDGMNLAQQTIDGIDFTELLYADDTALITTTAPSMNKLVAKIDKCAAYFGLHFNHSKCVAMNYNTNRRTKFKNGEPIPTAEETMYLGAVVRKDHGVRSEITRKFGTCFATLKKLDLFWNNNNCPKKFRLQVFDAVIRSKLVYGLESVMLTKSLLNKLDVLQLKGLRKILGIKTTFVDRANTNQSVYNTANTFKNPNHKPDKDIRKFSTYVLTQQRKLLAHTIRADPRDPIRLTTLNTVSDMPTEVGKRRVGRPRKNWTWSTYSDLFVLNSLGTAEQFKIDPEDGIQRVAQLARDRNIIC